MARTDVERILFALDACSDVSDRALDSVVAMAARLDAALEGLFVADAQLLRAAQLPFSTEIGRTGRERSLSPASIRQANDSVSAHIARQLQRAASTHNVRWKLTQTAGSRLAAALQAAEHQDVLLAARATRASSPVTGAGDFTRVCLLHDASAPIQRALEVVCALGANGHTREVVLLGRHGPPAALLASLHARGFRTFAQLLAGNDTGALLRESGARGSGLLIASRALLLAAPPSPAESRLLEALTLPLLLLH